MQEEVWHVNALQRGTKIMVSYLKMLIKMKGLSKTLFRTRIPLSACEMLSITKKSTSRNWDPIIFPIFSMQFYSN